MSKPKGGSPRKFSEKIALLNRKEAEANAEFAKIIKEVEETTRAPQQPQLLLYPSRASSSSSWLDGSCAYGVAASIAEANQTSTGSLGNHNQFLTTQYNPTTTTTTSGMPRQHQHNDCSMQMHHHHHNHDQCHQQQQQQQHHLLHCQQLQQQQPLIAPPSSPTATTASTPTILDQQISVETPVGVPNINIFPIDDDNDYQQQVPNLINGNSNINHNCPASYRNDCSNSISSARSLPDIANLRVSGNSPVLTPAYSDQRITTDYDCNSSSSNNNNILVASPTNSAHNFYNICNGNQHNQQQQAHLQQQQGSWQVAGFANHHQQQQQNSHPQQQTIQQQQQNYCQPFQEGNIVRANSTNAVLCRTGWTTTTTGGDVIAATNSSLISAPRINNNLSKSTEVCYGYKDDSNSSNCCGGANPTNDQFNVSGQMIIRSSSFNNIENIDFQGDNARNTYSRQQQAQTFILEDPTQYQFYER